MRRWRLGLLGVALPLLTACYTADTAVLDDSNALALPGVGAGTYCHLAPSLDPVEITATAETSPALGDNQCRDLSYDADAARYVDARSPTMLLRIGALDGPLWLLQVQTNADAPARYAPIAATDGLFIQFDPRGEWPSELVAANPDLFAEDGTLTGAAPDTVRALLSEAFADALALFRADLSLAGSGESTALHFADYDATFSYLVYARDDLRDDPTAFAAALTAIADQLDLNVADGSQ